MALYKMLVGWQLDTALPADKVYVTPWFNDHGLTSDPTQLCTDIVEGLVGPGKPITATVQCQCTAYEHTPGDPTSGPPVGFYQKNPTAIYTAAGYREQALCLSFYAGSNTPRRRGRLFFPAMLMALAADYARPDNAAMTKVLGIGTILSAIGGADVDWVVHSVTEDASFKVTNCWVDDEWDSQRRRGLKASRRVTASVSG